MVSLYSTDGHTPSSFLAVPIPSSTGECGGDNTAGMEQTQTCFHNIMTTSNRIKMGNAASVLGSARNLESLAPLSYTVLILSLNFSFAYLFTIILPCINIYS